MKDWQLQSESFEKNFSAFLKRARGSQKQAPFARFLGLSQPTYQRYESGRIPDGAVLYQIATRLGVTIEEILTGRPPKPNIPEPNHFILNEGGASSDPSVSGPTITLESDLAGLVASIPVARLPAKKLLTDQVLKICYELKRRYTAEEIHWRSQQLPSGEYDKPKP